MASFTALAESLGEDLAGLLTPHLPTRSGLHLSLTSKSLQALCSSQTWERQVLGRALGSTGSTLGDNAALTGLLHRAAMDQHRFERHRKLQQQERRLEMSSRKRPCPASTFTEPFGVPLPPNESDRNVHRRFSFGVFATRGALPPPAELRRYRPYLSAVSAHPPPTRAQIVAFANYLSTAHSWYKHLPAPPGSAFYVYFDPTAMMQPCRVVSSDGNHEAVGYRELSDGLCHYSMLRTREYRKRYSICNWLLADDGGVLPPTVHDIDATPLLLPPRVAAGTDSLVYLSAMCYQPHPGIGAPLSAATLRERAATLRELLRRDPDSRALALALERTETLAKGVDGVEEVLAQHNGAVLGGGPKRHALLQAVYETQHRAERAAIVDVLTRQAQAIWGVEALRDE